MADIVITGFPRSGTTLTCYLLNRCENTVALHEGIGMRRLSRLLTRTAVCDAVQEYFDVMRRQILSTGTVRSKHIDGQIPDNPFRSTLTTAGLRKCLEEVGTVAVDKPLSKTFNLIIKQIGGFTALLPEIADRFPCYALIRNPLAMIASWNSCEIPVRDGHLPGGEMIDPKLANDLDAINDRFDRQLYILSWMCEKYVRHLPPESILKYEDIIESGGKILGNVVREATEIDETLENKNLNTLYDRETMNYLAERLRKTSGPIWEIYPKSCIDDLLDADNKSVKLR